MNDVVERVARAICQSKGINPDCLYQHNFDGDFPEDERREYHVAITGEPRVMLFHRAWRHSDKAARAAIIETLKSLREPTEAMVDAGDEVIRGRYGCRFEVQPIWSAMLSAALADASPDIGKEGIVSDVR